MDNSEEIPKRTQKDMFYKQQQQMLQNITIKKDLCADDLIRNILEKVDSDAKISKLCVSRRNTQYADSSNSKPQNENVMTMDSSSMVNGLQIPPCFLQCTNLPTIYGQVWDAVKLNDNSDLCDRDKLYQILLHSKLASNVLAQLWAFVNRTIPGQLTRHELYIMLPLISLVQANNLDPVNELYNKCINIPIPNFGDLFSSVNINTFTPIDSNVKEVELNQQLIPEVTTTEIIDDDFADFKSAELIVESNNDLFKENCSVSDTIDNFPSKLNENELEIDITEFSPNELDNQSDINLFSIGTNESESDGQHMKHSTSNNSFAPLEDDSSQADKYSSLRQLTTNDSDDFGDFFSHSTTIQNDCDQLSAENDNDIQSYEFDASIGSIDHSMTNVISNKRKILSACRQVMQKTFNILIVSHGEDSVLEALGSKDGANFVFDLKEVYTIALRIESNLSMLDNIDERNQCKSIVEEIVSKYELIDNIFRKSSIKIEEYADQQISMNSTLESKIDECEPCTICSDGCPLSSNKSLSFAGFRYHINCANFWLNFVGSSLPRKQYDENF